MRLLSGADVHMAPDLLSGLNDGRIITLAGSRYLLLEPPIISCRRNLKSASLLAVRRLCCDFDTSRAFSWIEPQYALIRRMVYTGAFGFS